MSKVEIDINDSNLIICTDINTYKNVKIIRCIEEHCCKAFSINELKEILPALESMLEDKDNIALNIIESIDIVIKFIGNKVK